MARLKSEMAPTGFTASADDELVFIARGPQPLMALSFDQANELGEKIADALSSVGKLRDWGI
jgi:hypothetical protein